MSRLGKKNSDALLGGLVIGLAGAGAGFFMAEGNLLRAAFTLGGAGIGGLLGVVTAAFGGRRFFLFIVAGSLLGALLGIFLGGMDEAVLGAATGGTIGGFSGVMAGAIGK